MSDFQDKLAVLLSVETARGRRDPERMATLIGSLVDGLALAIAIATIGNGREPDELLEGISVQLVEGVADKAPMAQFLAGVSRSC
jgi:hypothetical protein